jgi:WD40 repeat protein
LLPLLLTLLLLQGQIGKFGSLELTDVSAFVELPDGKVLSSSESGALLLWDSGFIKVVFCQPGGEPCHAAGVEVLLHNKEVNYILSGGADGVLRLWDFNKLNDADPREMAISCEVRPAVEVTLPDHGHIRACLWTKRTWLVLVDSGALLQVSDCCSCDSRLAQHLSH